MWLRVMTIGLDVASLGNVPSFVCGTNMPNWLSVDMDAIQIDQPLPDEIGG